MKSVLRSRATKAPKLCERAVQRAILKHLEALGCYAAHVPNGSQLAGDARARAKQVAGLKRDGMRPGFPDLIVFDTRGNGVGFIEVKREGRAAPDPAQIWWRDELRRLGHPWALVNTPDGAAAALHEWGWR